MRKAVAFVILCLTSFAGAQSEPQSTVSSEPLNAEQIAVYRAFLATYLRTEEVSSLNLSRVTEPLSLDPQDIEGCAAGIDSATVKRASQLTHTFGDDAKQFGNIVLVDPKQQLELIARNDPDNAIRNGNSVDLAVAQAFSAGLFTFSEIAFSEDGKLAVFGYRFYCGRLCANGGTIVMQKIGSEWRQGKRACRQWIS